MRVPIKMLLITAMLFAAFPLFAQVPPGAPSPAAVNREVNNAQREANDVKETVQAVNDAIDAIKKVKKMIDSVVANDKSHTAGEVHLIFFGISFTDENLQPVEDALKTMKGVTDLKKLQKTATVTFEMKSSMMPIDIWKDIPKKAQKYFIVHDKDPYNVVLLFRAPPKAKN